MATRPNVFHADEAALHAYQICGLLGRGAFGLVYAARLMGPDGFVRPVALKALRPAYTGNAALVAQLKDEARALARLRHPAFVQVDRMVELELGWTIVMERVDGVDLQRLATHVPRLPLRPALEIAALVAGALHAAWAGPDESRAPLRMLHRDLKPANLMLTPLGAVKICDLGIAATAEDARGCTFGTPDYAAPERFNGREGPEADVYALAVVLYELITGERFGLGTPVREHHDVRWREALAILRAVLAESARQAEPVYDLIRFSLAFEPAVRPPADAFEAACLAVAAQLHEEPLRAWASREVPPLLAEALEQEPDDEDLVAEVVLDEETPTLIDLSKDSGLRV